MSLTELCAQAAALASGDCRDIGHAWDSDGGRACPKGRTGCSQTVYVCLRCDETDYGDPGGPGYADCFGSDPCPQGEWL